MRLFIDWWFQCRNKLHLLKSRSSSCGFSLLICWRVTFCLILRLVLFADKHETTWRFTSLHLYHLTIFIVNMHFWLIWMFLIKRCFRNGWMLCGWFWLVRFWWDLIGPAACWRRSVMKLYWTDAGWMSLSSTWPHSMMFYNLCQRITRNVWISLKIKFDVLGKLHINVIKS